MFRPNDPPTFPAPPSPTSGIVRPSTWKRILMELERTPAMSRRRLCAGTGISPATVQKSVRYLQDKGILSESVGFAEGPQTLCR